LPHVTAGNVLVFKSYLDTVGDKTFGACPVVVEQTGRLVLELCLLQLPYIDELVGL
jgi:hypothetical protein